MSIEDVDQVCVMMHSGSRGLGHQVATDALTEMEKSMKRDNILVMTDSWPVLGSAR